MRKRASSVKAGRKAQRTIVDRRVEEMTRVAIGTAQRHGEPFRNPYWLNGPGKLYPVKYVKKYSKGFRGR